MTKGQQKRRVLKTQASFWNGNVFYSSSATKQKEEKGRKKAKPKNILTKSKSGKKLKKKKGKCGLKSRNTGFLSKFRGRVDDSWKKWKEAHALFTNGDINLTYHAQQFKATPTLRITLEKNIRT